MEGLQCADGRLLRAGGLGAGQAPDPEAGGGRKAVGEGPAGPSGRRAPGSVPGRPGCRPTSGREAEEGREVEDGHWVLASPAEAQLRLFL